MAHDTHKKYTVDEFYSMDLPERCELPTFYKPI